MKKTFLPVILTIGLFSGVAAYPMHSFAASATQQIDQQLNDLKKLQSTMQQNSQDTQKQMQSVQVEKQQTGKDLNTILDQIDETNKQLSALNDKMNVTTENLKKNGQQLDEAEARVKERDQKLRSRVRLMYINGTVSYTDVLMSSTSFSDFLGRIDALASIVSQDKEILQTNKKDRDFIVTKKKEIETQLAEIKSYVAQSQAIKAQMLVKEKEKEVKVASLSQKEKELGDVSVEQQNQLMVFAKQEADLIHKKKAAEEAAAAAAASAAAAARAAAAKNAAAAAAPSSGAGASGGVSAPAYNGGTLAFPLPRYYPLTSPFGTRIDPLTGAPGAFHTGLDFGAPEGTTILAAESGTVIVAGWTNGYGNTVIIEHDNSTWTLYGHIRNGGLAVQKGDTVRRGQKVAEVGSTGRSTGNHLHFEVRKSGTAVDPTPYLK